MKPELKETLTKKELKSYYARIRKLVDAGFTQKEAEEAAAEDIANFKRELEEIA